MIVGILLDFECEFERTRLSRRRRRTTKWESPLLSRVEGAIERVAKDSVYYFHFVSSDCLRSTAMAQFFVRKLTQRSLLRPPDDSVLHDALAIVSTPPDLLKSWTQFRSHAWDGRRGER